MGGIGGDEGGEKRRRQNISNPASLPWTNPLVAEISLWDPQPLGDCPTRVQHSLGDSSPLLILFSCLSSSISASSSPFSSRCETVFNETLLRSSRAQSIAQKQSHLEASGWPTLSLCVSDWTTSQASENPSLFQPRLSSYDDFNHIACGKVWWGQREKLGFYSFVIVSWREHNTPRRATLGVPREAKGEGTMGKYLYYGFCGKEWVRHSKQA